MQGPMRKSEQFRKFQDEGGPVYLTATGKEKLERALRTLQAELPQAVAEVGRTKEFGDLSENAAYQDAKARLRRIHGQIFSVQDKLKRAQIIKKDNGGFVAIGSVVVLEMNGSRKQFEIVGPQETDPSRGRISHLSPLGAALIGHIKGDTFSFRDTTYRILEIK